MATVLRLCPVLGCVVPLSVLIACVSSDGEHASSDAPVWDYATLQTMLAKEPAIDKRHELRRSQLQAAADRSKEGPDERAQYEALRSALFADSDALADSRAMVAVRDDDIHEPSRLTRNLGPLSVGVEAWMQQEPLGRPIQVLRTPVLAPGTYEIETSSLVGDPSLFPPDTVLAVRTRGDVGARTLWGADECETQAPFEVRRSCVRFSIDSPMQPFVWVWARHQLTQGETDIRIQQLASMDAPRNEAACPVGTVGGFCWQPLATAVPFGGMSLSAQQLGDNLDRIVRLETGELPGAELAESPSEHAIVFYDGTRRGWNLLPNRPKGTSYEGAPYSHDRKVAGTAQWVGLVHEARMAAPDYDPSAYDPAAPFVLVGPLGAGTGGPYRLFRNDRVEFHTPNGVLTRGIDWDADGLGEQLEAWLGTCDSPSSPESNGFACSDLPGCDGSDDHLCRAACRDSDQDALRDDHELFGVTLFEGARVEGMELARYGTDPGTFDLLVEIDYLSEPEPHWFLVPEPICSEALATQPPPPVGGFVTPVPGYPTAEEFYARWLSPDALPIPVPPAASAGNEQCWVYGVVTATRLDGETLAGVTEIYRNIPNFKNRSGAPGIAVHFDAGIPPEMGHRGLYGDWGGSQLVPLFDAGTPPEEAYPPASYIAPQRRWLFRHVNYSGNGGGKSGVIAQRLLAGAPYALAHELGHAGGLTHEGPVFDPAAVENYNPFYLSRINYLYEGIPVTGPTATVVTFSDGGAPGPFNPVELDERCPFGIGQELPPDPDIRNKIRGANVFNYDDLVPNCQPIDWNLDGALSPVPVQAPLWPDHRRSKRTYFLNDAGDEQLRFGLRVGVADLALGENSLVMAAIETPRVDDSYAHRPYILFSGPVECAECSNIENNCWSRNFGEKVYLTDEVGAPIEDAEAIAVTWLDGRYLWVVHRGDNLAWGELGESDGESSVAGVLEYTVSTNTYETALGLTTIGPNHAVLAFRLEDGTVQLARSEAGPLGGPSLSWSTTPEVAMDAAGQPIVVTPDTAVGLGILDGAMLTPGSDPQLVLAASIDDGRNPVLTLFTAPLTSNTWTVAKQLPHKIRARPDLAQVSYPSGDRLVISWQKLNTGESFTVESFPNDLSQFLGEEGARLYSTTFPNPIVWDDRAGVLPGLRAWYSENRCEPGSCPLGMACVGQNGNTPGPGEAFLECRSVNPDGSVHGPETDANQFLIPFHDGIVPADFHDMDDRPMLRYGFCAALRRCEGAYSGVCTPVEWRELDPSGTSYAERLCAETDYTEPACVPRVTISEVNDPSFPGSFPPSGVAPDFLTGAASWIRGPGLWGDANGMLPGSVLFAPDEENPPSRVLVAGHDAFGYDAPRQNQGTGLSAWQADPTAFASLHNGQGGTFVAVFKVNGVSRSGFVFDNHKGNPSLPGFSMHVMANGQVQVLVGSQGGPILRARAKLSRLDEPHFVIFRYNPQAIPQWSLFVDQGQSPDKAGPMKQNPSTGPAAHVPRLLARHGQGAKGTFPLDGRIAELAAFDFYLDDNQLVELADYLRERYGIE